MEGYHHSIAGELSEHGYRMTPQRMMIFDAIEHSSGHISVEEIHARIVTRYPNVNISTVYRTLELLKKLGLVMEADLGEGRVRYHPVDKGRHHHLVCRGCGQVIDLDESLLAPLKAALLREYGFNADLNHLAILGLCLKCGKQGSGQDDM